MTDRNDPAPEERPLFTEQEWEAAKRDLTRAMTAYLKQYRTPIFIDLGEYGESWGSGSFIELEGRKFILTNEHVARKRESARLGYRLDEQEDMPHVIGNHVAQEWPWDLALLPVDEKAWALQHCSAPIQPDQIALTHTPSHPAEVFAFAGYAGERTTFNFGQMQFGSTTSLAQEVKLADHAEIDHRFHFGMDYLPDRATSVVGDKGLPMPSGLSGSTVWNTRFVEAKARRIDWSPELAKVAGVVWGWPSGLGAIVATKAEHLRSFLLGAATALD